MKEQKPTPVPDFRALFEAAPNIYLVLSPDLTIVAASDACCRASRCERDQILGRHLFDVYPANPDDPDGTAASNMRASLVRVLQFRLPDAMAVQKYDIRRPESEGGGYEERYWAVLNSPVLNDAGEVAWIIHRSEDVTEMVRLQAKADTRGEEQQLRQAVKMEAVGQLTGGIAHDFNNLLGIIIGNLDIAAEHAAADPALRGIIQEALGGALRGAELTRRLLAFSRKQPLQPANVDLNQGLPQVAGMLRRTLGEQVLVELHPGAGLWMVRVDPAQLDEAILSLAINARDAMPTGGMLSIETQNIRLDRHYAVANAEVTAGDYVQLSISDTSSGMAPDVVERCFEPFFTTKGIEKGTGLGLSMVYGFVKQSGGHIKIYSEVGHGTSVKIYLPRADSSAAAAEARVDSAEAGSALGTELVLMVEDNKDLRTVTAKQLADLGYRTLEAESAKTALQMLAEHPGIDLLFTDIIMPGGMTGTDLAREARRLYPKLKILLTSGYTARAMANGFHDIEGLQLLNKPFRKRDLARKLRGVLERA